MTGSQRFVKERQDGWNALEELLNRVRTGGLKKLGEQDLLELSKRYRSATSDLAHAQAFIRDAQVIGYLNDLVGRAHGVLYRSRGARLHSVGSFLSWGYPTLVRKHWRPIVLAAVLLFGSGVFGYSVVKFDYDARAAVLSVGAQSMEGQFKDKERWAEIASEDASMVSSSLFVNNIRVALMAFALGIFAGIGTALILLFNGVSLGAVFGLADHHGVLDLLLTFVAPHGVIELTCICIAGGAGFVIASALLMPGRRSVRDALVENGREAVLLMLGTAPLLVLAGLIEGFISPLPTPAWFQLSFAFVPAGFLVWYLARRAPSRQN